MYQEEVVLCGSSAYNKKYYLSEDFEGLPQGIQDELKIMCVLYTEDVGGTLELVFDEEGKLSFRTDADEGDLLYDEIGSVLKIKQLQRDKRELLEALELYFRVFFLGEEFEEE
ncbi:MAG: DUF6145 family protein [Lachnospiraceae bacterium]|nr:DUF6145 family protein [Lachnospiraceae bacterium]MDD6183587.1 DUF6145 family protein [Lachnospiraceae bacterium]MDD7377975.1 DUF6145 family protein [Lachnospiraceae bacterium]MDY4616957.1 DUF6145 family protein [Lachnospiraceae bacterium]MDY5774493.1 DUF6145 family protein [Lachnospiraceae bacterium]